jgi:hypothetical protein
MKKTTALQIKEEAIEIEGLDNMIQNYFVHPFYHMIGKQFPPAESVELKCPLCGKMT